MQQYKRIIIGSALLICAGFAHAEKKVLTVAAYPAVDQIVKDSLAVWSKDNPDVEVKVVGREYSDHHTAMTTALAASSGLPDIMTIEYGYLGRFANSGGFENLLDAPYTAGKYQNEIVPFAWAQANHAKYGQTALPTDIGPGAMFFRADLLKAAGLSDADLNQSWESFIEAAKRIKETSGARIIAHARDVKDIVIRTGIQPGSGIYFDSNGKSVVGTDPRFKRAFELAKTIRDEGLDADIGAWSNEWGEALRRGDVATQMMGAWLGGHLKNWLAPDTAGKWRSTTLPEGANVSWGGTFYAIPKQSNNKELAWSLIKHLTLNRDQQEAAFVKHDAFPAMVSAHDAQFFEKPIPFLGDQVARPIWRKTAMAIVPTAVFKHDAVAEEIVNAELDLVLTKGKSVSDAIADAERMVARRARR
jgi:multiple sugar transport system substrate-binding protein